MVADESLQSTRTIFVDPGATDILVRSASGGRAPYFRREQIPGYFSERTVGSHGLRHGSRTECECCTGQ